MRNKFLVIYTVAFLLRLINLNQSLWLDEAVVAKVVKTIPFHLIPFQFSPGDFHPPLYYLLMSLWTRIFGFSEIALRMPSIISSLLTGFIVYKIGLILTDKKTALWAMVFFLFNPLIIYYSQEARMYMFTTFFLTSALFFFIRLTSNEYNVRMSNIPSKKLRINKSQKSKVKINNHQSPISNHVVNLIFLIIFIVFIVLSIVTFYGSLFFVGAMLIYALIQKKYKIVIILLFTISFSLILLSPLLYQQLQTANTGLIDVKNWSLVLGKANMKNLFLIFIKFTSGRLSWSPKWSYYLLSGFWFLVVGFLVFLGMKKNKILSILFILPVLFAFVTSFFIPMLQYFRFLFLIPVMSVLLAKGVNSFCHSGKFRRSRERIQNLILDDCVWCQNDGRPRASQFIYFLILFFYCAFSLVYLLTPSFHREDWKSLSQYLDSSKPVYMILPSSDPLSYYRKDIILKELRIVTQQKQIEKNIYIIPYVVEIYGFDYKKELINKGCVLSKQTSFRELRLEEWSCGYMAMMPLRLN